jgi:hypothetical protein
MLTVIIVVAIIAIIIMVANNNKKKIAALKLRYEESLEGKDKRAALDAGRAYYSALRKGKTLTIYDEQAITNDLSTMS